MKCFRNWISYVGRHIKADDVHPSLTVSEARPDSFLQVLNNFRSPGSRQWMHRHF